MKPQPMEVRAGRARRGRTITGLFDTGSEDGLMRRRACRGLTTARLPEPVEILGIGGGTAPAGEMVLFQVRILGKWCRYGALVIDDGALDVDLLVGEDFLSRYGLSVDARRNRVVVSYPEQFRRMTGRRIFVASPRRRGRRDF